jgi:hypothetical protein
MAVGKSNGWAWGANIAKYTLEPHLTMFFCAISGEPPQEPVVSIKSRKVYDRRLIVKYINENGTDPITGDKLEEADLIAIEGGEYLPNL